MTSGFDAVPDELRRTANAITDVAGGADGLTWREPSGDYGHTGVQQGFSAFVRDMRDRVEQLRGKADEHGANLHRAAGEYVESDTEGRTSLSGIGAAVGETGMVGGGWAGPVKQRGVDLGGGQSGVMSPQRSRELFGDKAGAAEASEKDIGDTLNPGETDGRAY